MAAWQGRSAQHAWQCGPGLLTCFGVINCSITQPRLAFGLRSRTPAKGRRAPREMQALRRSFLHSIAALKGTAQRVGAAGSGSVDAALANAPQAAAAALAGTTSTSSGSCASAWARWRSTAAAAAESAPADSPFKEYTSAPALTRHQVLKRLLKPENSGRKRFKRNWQKQLQIKVSRAGRRECGWPCC